MGFKLSEVEISGFSKDAQDEPDWYVVCTQSRREEVALVNLRQQGFEAYLPLYKTVKKSPAGSLPAFEPMFPRYVFFRPGQASQSISGARSTRGVSFVLSFGFSPAALKPDEIRLIRACESERNGVDLREISPFQPGRQARLSNCGLQGLEGLVQSVSARRVTLLIELLGRQKTVSVEHHQLELA